MHNWGDNEQRALALIVGQGADRQMAEWMLSLLHDAGLRLADLQRDELVCRWVPVGERAVPPEADTIIRTITRSFEGRSESYTFWLDGLRAPRIR
jgi:hypothetical protein